ncbi:hypothetical protein RHOSPDRAFT_33184 [Rhodotorula sp. JG-1b]|nr:hypothetical protein RHOSPDRAFT_33184 [Rhodotorula sp. JG-1b]
MRRLPIFARRSKYALQTPLELEVTFLELAAPPLAFDRLHDHVEFFIYVALVHRSLTPWAQERLHDQFLYTYQARPNEHKRLKTRLEAGFGRDRPLRRLFLNLTYLPADIHERIELGTDSVSATIDGRVYGAATLTSGPDDTGEGSTSVQEPACDAVAHFTQDEDSPTVHDHWTPGATITARCQSLDTLWLMPPALKLDIPELPPLRVLHIDRGGFNTTWGSFRMVPAASTTCGVRGASVDEVLDQCPHLDTLVLSETLNLNLLSAVEHLPASIRHVHILHLEVQLDDVGVPYPAPDARLVLSHLESFTFTLLPDWEYERSTEDDAEALGDLKRAVNLLVDAPRCTFRDFSHSSSEAPAAFTAPIVVAMFAPRSHFAALLLAVLAAVSVQAQLETTVDDLSGNTVVVSVATDADGDPSLTRTLLILTDTETSTSLSTATTTSLSTATTATTTANPATENLGAPAQVLTPQSTCTTAGCPVNPTTYTQNGVIVTWYATTPAIVTPTAWSSGGVQAPSAYAASITTQSAYQAQVQSAKSGAGSRYPLASVGEWSIMLGVTVVGGLVGAVALL